MKLREYAIIIITMLSLMSSCRRHTLSEDTDSPNDRVFLFPDTVVAYVDGKRMVVDYSAADYKIVTFVDSSRCTSCSMDLQEWELLMNSYKAVSDVDINFLMVVNSSETDDILKIAVTEAFAYPLAIVNNSEFRLLYGHLFPTILLNADNRIVATGNPIKNTDDRATFNKILYPHKQVQFPDNIRCPHASVALGIINPNKAKKTLFTVYNTGKTTQYIDDITTSCPCFTVESIIDSIAPGKSIDIVTTLLADSTLGYFRRCATIHFQDVDTPLILTVNGYIQ